jgi:hypothetical protein
MASSPLTVTVTGGNHSRVLEVSGLEFTRSARGGFLSASFAVPAWVDTPDPALGPMARVSISDARTTRRVFEGYLDIPGRSVEASGHTWRIGAVGAASVLTDRHRAYFAISSNLSDWRQSFTSSPEMSVSMGAQPDTENEALLFTVGRGIAVDTGYRTTAIFDLPRVTGQKAGGFTFTSVNGVADVNWRTEMYMTGDTTGQIARFRNFQTTSGTVAAASAGSEFTTGHNVFGLRMRRDAGGATNIADDVHWSAVTAARVSALRVNQAGTTISGASTYAADYLYAHDIIYDALWWFTNKVDIPGASIDATFTHPIDQFSYPDGARLSDLFNDLALLEPDLIWEVLESNAAGLHRLDVRRWTTAVRYEADTSDGFSAPGGEMDLANSLRIYWTDKTGVTQSSTYTTTVDELNQWGRTRDADPIELGAEVGTQGAADRIGAGLLAQIAAVPFAGTLTLARPIWDRLRGRSVMPWEIEPGYLLSIRDLPNAPAVRLTEVSYSDDSASATLTLGTPVMSTEELVTKLARPRRRAGGGERPVSHA